MRESGGRPILAAVAGATCIATSAVFMKLAGSSPSVTALGRCGLALPVLAVLAWRERRAGAGRLRWRARWLSRVAGVFLAADLIAWSHTITDIGAGLGTVLPNLQVLLVAGLAWLLLGERPKRSLLIASPVMLGGLVLVGGLAGTGGYGAHPGLGVAYGVGVAILYAAYIFLLRQATGPRVAATEGEKPPVAAVLYEATLGATAGSLVIGLALRDFRLGPAWPALGWLLVLAMTSQVIGWLLITTSMPRLPAWLVGALLLVQPIGSLLLSAVFLGERPSLPQIGGAALMLAGVVIAVTGLLPGRGGPRSAPEPVGRSRRLSFLSVSVPKVRKIPTPTEERHLTDRKQT